MVKHLCVCGKKMKKFRNLEKMNFLKNQTNLNEIHLLDKVVEDEAIQSNVV